MTFVARHKTYLFVLAGVPGTYMPMLIKRLRDRYYPQTADFVGISASKRTNAYNVAYSDAYVHDLLQLTHNYVFDQLARPRGFCSKPDKACTLAFDGKGTCRKGADEACRLRRPESIVLLYHGASVRSLIDRFRPFVYPIRLSVEVYNKENTTFKEICTVLAEVKGIMGKLNRKLTSASTPFLLPLRNFDGKALTTLLGAVANRKELPQSLERRFFEQYWRRDRESFVDDRDIVFNPKREHGEPRNPVEPRKTPVTRLSSFYRLGALYHEQFHYDVSRRNGRGFEDLAFFCCEVGPCRIKGDHANVYPNDYIRSTTVALT